VNRLLFGEFPFFSNEKSSVDSATALAAKRASNPFAPQKVAATLPITRLRQTVVNLEQLLTVELPHHTNVWIAVVI